MLDEAVRIRLVSDVPLGAFLSGGVDSSTVVALMARHMGQPVKTFSIGFLEDSYNELKYARLAAKRFGTDHHEFFVTPEICNIVDELAWHFDEPFADSSAIPTYIVSKLAREHVPWCFPGTVATSSSPATHGTLLNESGENTACCLGDSAVGSWRR